MYKAIVGSIPSFSISILFPISINSTLVCLFRFTTINLDNRGGKILFVQLLVAKTQEFICVQSANVWFLPNFDSVQLPEYTFTCTVPQGKAIIVGNLNQGESDYGITPGDEATRQGATAGQKGASLKVWLDGVNQNYSLKDMRVTSDFFNLSFVKNNVVNGPEGTYKGMIDGYYIFLKPLSQGKHNLHFESEVTNNPGFELAQKGNWIFNVK
jgi:hypothetical protein